ncbi:hypothetical protein Q1695_006050 [Nippostrongylus brasiliensis]|nr:hypothetical protein Q1695_006050 [Nippostrongylus brasiliensis]
MCAAAMSWLTAEERHEKRTKVKTTAQMNRLKDSGRYKCQISNQSEQLEFQVEVLESGLKGGFHENISYDHSECCQEKGISPLCRAMCKLQCCVVLIALPLLSAGDLRVLQPSLPSLPGSTRASAGERRRAR